MIPPHRMAYIETYNERGLNVIPLKGKDKIPAVPKLAEYFDRKSTPTELESWFGNGHDYNIGIITGSISGLIVIDIDGDEAKRKFQTTIETLSTKTKKAILETMTIRTGGGGFHFYFKTDKPINHKKLWVGEGHNEVAIKGEGGYVVAPPSIHPSGNTYEIANDVYPQLLTEQQIREITAAFGVKERKYNTPQGMETTGHTPLTPEKTKKLFDLILPHYTEGRRNYLSLTLAGYLRKCGVPLENTVQFISLLVEKTGDGEKDSRILSVYRTYEKDLSEIQGYSALRELLPTGTLDSLAGLSKEPEKPKDTSTVEILKLPQLGVKYADSEIGVEAKVIGVSERKPNPETVRYKCQNPICGEINPAESNGAPPERCMECDGKNMKLVLKDAKDMQVVLVHADNLNLSCVVKDEKFIYAVKPGQNAGISGFLRFEEFYNKNTKKMDFRKFIEVTSLESSTRTDVEVTQADIERFAEMVKDPIHFQILVESYAPNLVGIDELKEICIYTLGSCGISRPFNALLAGPPARGKTQLLEWTAAMHPVGFKVTATGASLAGLTSITEKDPDTETHITKPGLFALYDGGIVCITELQAIKTKEAVKTSLNDALESKEVSGAKADGPVKLAARCAVLFDTNNYAATWYYDSSFAHNIKFMEPNLGAFISRLDLISVVPQVNDKEFYRQVARSNFKTTDTAEALEKYKADYEVDGIPHYGVDTLRKYFAYCTSIPLPELSPTTEEYFVENYAEVNESAKEFTVDGRYNRSVKTLARVRARLLLKPEADLDDLKEAIRIVNRSKDIETKAENGERDANATVGCQDKKTIRKEEQFWDCFESLKAIKGVVTRKDWIEELVSVKQWKQEDAEKMIAKAENASKIMGVASDNITRL